MELAIGSESSKDTRGGLGYLSITREVIEGKRFVDTNHAKSIARVAKTLGMELEHLTARVDKLGYVALCVARLRDMLGDGSDGSRCAERYASGGTWRSVAEEEAVDTTKAIRSALSYFDGIARLQLPNAIWHELATYGPLTEAAHAALVRGVQETAYRRAQPSSDDQKPRRSLPITLAEAPFQSTTMAGVATLDWQGDALCAQTDPEAFFPEKGGSVREAKRVCASCEVCAECLGYALSHDIEFGVWGGLTERQRRKLKRHAV